MDRHLFDADPDPDPNLHVDADPDPDPTGIKTMPILMRTDPTPGFTRVGKSDFFLFLSSSMGSGVGSSEMTTYLQSRTIMNLWRGPHRFRKE